MNTFDAYVHRPNVYIQLFDSRQKVEEVVRRQSQLSRFDIVRLEIETCERQGRRQGTSR